MNSLVLTWTRLDHIITPKPPVLRTTPSPTEEKYKYKQKCKQTITRILRFAMCDNYTCVVSIGATTPEGFANQKGQDSDRHFDTPPTSDVFRILIFRRLSLKNFIKSIVRFEYFLFLLPMSSINLMRSPNTCD